MADSSPALMQGYSPKFIRIHTITVDGVDIQVRPWVVVRENDHLMVWPDKIVVNGKQMWPSRKRIAVAEKEGFRPND